jgi:hypothetical protein
MKAPGIILPDTDSKEVGKVAPPAELTLVQGALGRTALPTEAGEAERVFETDPLLDDKEGWNHPEKVRRTAGSLGRITREFRRLG